jgi:hypothetical protein
MACILNLPIPQPPPPGPPPQGIMRPVNPTNKGVCYVTSLQTQVTALLPKVTCDHPPIDLTKCPC